MHHEGQSDRHRQRRADGWTDRQKDRKTHSDIFLGKGMKIIIQDQCYFSQEWTAWTKARPCPCGVIGKVPLQNLLKGWELDISMTLSISRDMMVLSGSVTQRDECRRDKRCLDGA